MTKVINFAVADALDIQAAFKFAGLDEHPRYREEISSFGMARALKAEGYCGLINEDGFVRAVK